MSNEQQKAESARFREAKKLTKNDLARKFVSATVQLEQWTELSMAMAAYYINIEPHAEIFHGPTFSPNTLERIKERAMLALKDVPYARVIYIADQEDPGIKISVPVDVVTITDPEQWEKMIDGLNQERDRQADIERTDPPADCKGCLFGSSCNESALKTGLRVYNCGQYAPAKDPAGGDATPRDHRDIKPEPRTLEHHPDDPEGADNGKK